MATLPSKCLVFSALMVLACAVPPASCQPSDAKKLLRDTQSLDARSAGGKSFQIIARFLAKSAGTPDEAGTYTLLWMSPTEWKEEVRTPDFTQVRLAGAGGIWEAREPYYQSLRVWQLLQALAFSSRLSLWTREKTGKVLQTERNGLPLRCVTIKFGGPLRELCFAKDADRLVSEYYRPAGRTYNFSEYSAIGDRTFPRHIQVYDGSELAVDFSVTALQENPSTEGKPLAKPDQAVWRAWCGNPEPALPHPLPGKGATALKSSVTFFGMIGTDGKWARLRILESSDPAADESNLKVESMRQFSPATCGGTPVVVDTAFRR
ncbi:MAG TPA: hypothetical protein VK525_02790 [Candidatus Saccharimonadales bacterium]|nr:hypothetical protein [Candidatus Saccharimonadales bacterium]